MAKNNGGANFAPEKPYFDRAVRLENEMAALREDIKEVYTEAKERAAIDVKALKRAVKLYLEPSEKKAERELTEIEANRILEALGEYVNTPLGAAAARMAGEQPAEAQ